MTQLQGKYFTLKELAKEAGISYMQAYVLVHKNSKSIKRMGSQIIIPEDEAKDIIASQSIIKNAVPFTMAAKKLHIGLYVLYQLENKGLPVIKIKQRKYINNNVFKALESIIRSYQEQFQVVPINKINDIYNDISNLLN